MIVQSFLACLLLCSWNAFSYNLHVKSREISHSLNSIRHRCKEFDTDRDAGSDIWSELVKIDPMNYSDVNTELNSKNNKSANEERIESLKYNLEMETYKDESKVYLDEKSNTEEIVYSWNNIDMEKEAIVSYVQDWALKFVRKSGNGKIKAAKIDTGVLISCFDSLGSQLSFRVSLTPLLIPSLESVSSTSSFSSFFSPSFRSSGWMTQVLSLLSSASPSDGNSKPEITTSICLDDIVTSLRNDLSNLVNSSSQEETHR